MKSSKLMSRVAVISLVTVMLFFASCTDDIINVHATRPDPFQEGVRVEKIGTVSPRVSVTWSADAGADAYVLQRSKETGAGFEGFTIVYNGLDTEYTDLDIDADTAYGYRLDKKRGSKTIAGIKITNFNLNRPQPFVGDLTINEKHAGKGISDAAGNITINWDADEGADKYRLLKYEDGTYPGAPLGGPIETIDVGLSTSYRDVVGTTPGNDRFIYRLLKWRGNEWHVGSKYAFVVGAAANRDLNEPNNTDSQATSIPHDIDGNIYLYQFAFMPEGAPIRVEDSDFYKWHLAANTTTEFHLNYEDDSQGGASDGKGWLQVAVIGWPNVVNTTQPFYVPNSSSREADVIFSVSPSANFYAAFGSGVGGAVVGYTIQFVETTG